jgi:hypothetical protein
MASVRRETEGSAVKIPFKNQSFGDLNRVVGIDKETDNEIYSVVQNRIFASRGYVSGVSDPVEYPELLIRGPFYEDRSMAMQEAARYPKLLGLRQSPSGARMISEFARNMEEIAAQGGLTFRDLLTIRLLLNHPDVSAVDLHLVSTSGNRPIDLLAVAVGVFRENFREAGRAVYMLDSEIVRLRN